MALTILAGGDSFVYGSELADCNETYSKNTFPALLSEGNEYQCVAWPGYANDSIARTVINYCENNKQKDIFVIVSWTFPGRYEFRFDYVTGQRTGNWCAITPWTALDNNDEFLKDFKNTNDEILDHHINHREQAKRTGMYDFAKTFYKHVGGSEYWEIYSSLKEIVYLQNYLKTNNIGYLFTCASTDLFLNYTLEHKEEFCTNLHNQIDFDNWYIFSNTTPLGFYQWADFNKYRIGTTHPLEEAHRDAAHLMKGKFNELVKKNI
tara:strand:+ start:479 stop:1270 length:792 start_codon:yes stop_codon:yes gene_type:complete